VSFKHYVGGVWRELGTESSPIFDPATGQEIDRCPLIDQAGLDLAVQSAAAGFEKWRRVPAFERRAILHRSAASLRNRADRIAALITSEQGKPLPQGKAEAMAGADIIEWCADECVRAYGREIPSRDQRILQSSIREPIGPVAAFTPWNFPINQAVRKLAASLAAGCSIILKGPEETPSSVVELVQAFLDGGVEPEAINLVFGVPADVSTFLISHPSVRKISFTGSTAVGKELAALAGRHMKRMTMELGGHSPALVFDDADVDSAVSILGANKFRNAGQTCVSPTRFLVQEQAYEQFLSGFDAVATSYKIGAGMNAETTLGPLANSRRVDAMKMLVDDAVAQGATLHRGGRRAGNAGYFFEPTILTDVPLKARIMSEEPFGPIAIIQKMPDEASMISEANRLPYALAAYAYTKDSGRIMRLRAQLEAGMVSVNHHGVGLPETPFGGIKDSGYGSEGGSEALEAYQNVKFVSVLAA